MAPSKTDSKYAIRFTEYDLDNGMHVILAPSHHVPLIVTNLWYHVGSKDDPPARTGFAHLFEHMMFQGSKHVGKTEHFKYIQQVGGSLNATTSVDRTNYFQTLPAGELELALWLESDRMLALDVTEENFENQRAVVKEERRQRYENKPYGLVWENIVHHLFPTSGYHWTTIGSMEHLDQATIDDVREFHAEYYKPNNCSLALTGSFDEAEVRTQIERYFGNIPIREAVKRQWEPIKPVNGQIRLSLEDSAKLPAVNIAFQVPSAFQTSEYAFDLLGYALGGGRSSRLYRELVYKRKIARDIEAYNYALEKGGAFVLEARVQSSSSVEEVEEALWNEIKKVQQELLSSEELEKVKNRAEMRHIASLCELGPRADRLQRAWTFTRDTSRVNTELDRYRSITSEDIRTLANQYLQRDHSVVAHILPRTI